MRVIEFPGPKAQDVGFMECPCSEDAWFMPVAIADPHRPVIVGIQCPECEAYFDVVNGIVQDIHGGGAG